MNTPVDLNLYCRPFNSQEVDSFLGHIKRFLENHDVDMDPDYQRDHVWTDEQAGKFVGHILEGGKTSRILINCYPGDYTYEILDGKQRLTALLRWLDNDIPAILYDGVRARISELTPESEAMWRRLYIGFGRLHLSRRDALDLYIRLNRGGTVHSDAEIARVRELLAMVQESDNGTTTEAG